MENQTKNEDQQGKEQSYIERMKELLKGGPRPDWQQEMQKMEKGFQEYKKALIERGNKKR